MLDSSDGIPLENQDKVLDAFFTIISNLNKVGLELTVAQCLVHVHGGLIEISSAMGKGTYVMVMLPLELIDISKNIFHSVPNKKDGSKITCSKPSLPTI